MEETQYLLNPNIALRSWQRLPCAYYIKNSEHAKGLTNEEFLLLLQCDGNKLIHNSELLHSLVHRGFCTPCEPGAQLSAWQQPLFSETRYFPAINWEITGKCNYNCLHCFNAADNAPLSHEFSWEECVRLLDEAQACGVNAFTITGGEPMLHPHFMDILHGIHDRGMYVYEINTNGSFITEKMLNEMKSFGCTPLMKISFDGVGHHDWLRNRKGAEQVALDAIKLCIKMGFRTMVQTNVHRLNIDSMLETLELMDSLGVARTRIIRTTEAPRWIQNSDGLCEGGACLTFQEYYDAMLELTAAYIKEERNMEIDIWQFLRVYPLQKRYNPYPPIACTPKDYHDSIPVCKGNRGMIGLTASGELVPCLQLSGTYEAAGISLGNVKVSGLKALLIQGTYIDEVCTTVGYLAKKNKKCGACRWWKLCTGGCRAIGMALTGNRLGEDKAKCFYYEGGYIEKTEEVFSGSGYSSLVNIERESLCQNNQIK